MRKLLLFNSSIIAELRGLSDPYGDVDVIVTEKEGFTIDKR